MFYEVEIIVPTLYAVTVEADSKEAAEELAYAELAIGGEDIEVEELPAYVANVTEEA